MFPIETTVDENRHNPSGPQIRHQQNTTRLVAVPLIPGLPKHGRTEVSKTISSLSNPPVSSIPIPSGPQQSATQQDTNGNTLSVAQDYPSGPFAGKQGVIQPKDQVLDVYARSYVPVGLRAVNQEAPGDIAITETKHKINHEAYVSKFAGRDFLTHEPAPLDIELNNSLPPATELNQHSYPRYFAALLERDCIAKQQENEQYALYAVSLQAIPMPDQSCLWALSIPGLREDSPLVEMGDILHIRQLWVDWAGHPIQVSVPHRDDYGHGLSSKFWTGKQYNASVYSVSRVNETVYLRIDGLEHLTPYYQSVLPMVVNVVHPLKESVLQAQRRALLSTGRSLEQSSPGLEGVPVDLDGFPESSLGIGTWNARYNSSTAPRNDWTRRMLFPVKSDGRLQTKLRSVPHRALFDHAINYEQAHAVKSVCANDYGTLPYLISGPPGTGKTKTLVETAMQLLSTTDVNHMLICAPSEAAADTLAMRLKQYLAPKQLLRLNRPNRAENEVPRELLQYCYIQDDMFYLPPFQALLSFSVVVTSCRDAAILAEARLTNADLWTMERELVSALHPEDEPPTPSFHWGALLLDEAAQATEVDVLPAVSVIRPPSACPPDQTEPLLVMAGDEHQLGSRTASHDPAFSTSLFARLFARPLYADHPLSRSNVKPSSAPPVLKKSMLPILYPPFTNLIRNYRSHPAILSIPSSLFYNETLIPEAALSSSPLQTSSVWHGRNWPVLYIPHTGPDEIERDNGGWYNISEARLACSLAEQLVLEYGAQQSDICIMSPFAAQVKLLRATIRSQQYAGGTGLWDVNIGPVEAFQGLEKRVVIICTTRTRQRFVEDDVKRGMGLLQQKRKMNVALTRAKEALFVIGSPEVMGQDKHWRMWMAFCERNGLVDDRMGVWKNREEFKGGKIGVLERALIAKEEEPKGKQWPALGAAAADYDIDGEEYEAWTESLRKALDEQADDEEYEAEDDADETPTPEVLDHRTAEH